jgi:hypothetical protein
VATLSDDGRLIVVGLSTLVVLACCVALLVDIRDTLSDVHDELQTMRELAQGDAMRELEDEIEE